MSRKVVRLTLDHLDELHGAVPLLRVLGARPGPPRAASTTTGPGRRGRRVGLRGAARLGLVRAGGRWSTATRPGYALYAPEAFLPGAAVVPDGAGLGGRGAAAPTVYVAPDAPARRARAGCWCRAWPAT